jgi:hypothetical protein
VRFGHVRVHVHVYVYPRIVWRVHSLTTLSCDRTLSVSVLPMSLRAHVKPTKRLDKLSLLRLRLRFDDEGRCSFLQTFDNDIMIQGGRKGEKEEDY